jgi:1-pyrroline-5-carboxylate dehydrogenase
MATKVTYTSTALGDDTQNAAFERAVSQARSSVGEQLLLINGERRAGRGGSFELHNPADQDELLGTFAVASQADVTDAVHAARAAAQAWRATPYAHRARMLRCAARLIRERVAFLGAVVALEVGKNRVESVGEVEEAADLIDEYCRQMRRRRALSCR